MKVAFLGLGRMGTAMAQNLAKAGLLRAVWNRSEGRTALVRRGRRARRGLARRRPPRAPTS